MQGRTTYFVGANGQVEVDPCGPEQQEIYKQRLKEFIDDVRKSLSEGDKKEIGEVDDHL